MFNQDEINMLFSNNNIFKNIKSLLFECIGRGDDYITIEELQTIIAISKQLIDNRIA